MYTAATVLHGASNVVCSTKQAIRGVTTSDTAVANWYQRTGRSTV